MSLGNKAIFMVIKFPKFKILNDPYDFSCKNLIASGTHRSLQNKIWDVNTFWLKNSDSNAGLQSLNWPVQGTPNQVRPILDTVGIWWVTKSRTQIHQ